MSDLQDVFETISAKAEGIAALLLIISSEASEHCFCAALDYLSDAVREIEQIADEGANHIIQAAKTAHSA